jgi:hypothetical protein
VLPVDAYLVGTRVALIVENSVCMVCMYRKEVVGGCDVI